MEKMFFGLRTASLPDLSKWNTSKVINMNRMFCDCEFIKSLPDLSKWNTSNVKDMRGMFRNCKNLTSVSCISSWDIHNTNIEEMFDNCEKLWNVPLKFRECLIY